MPGREDTSWKALPLSAYSDGLAKPMAWPAASLASASTAANSGAATEVPPMLVCFHLSCAESHTGVSTCTVVASDPFIATSGMTRIGRDAPFPSILVVASPAGTLPVWYHGWTTSSEVPPPPPK